MAFTDRTYSSRYTSQLFPQGVKWLIIVNLAVFVIYFFARVAHYDHLFFPLGLNPDDVLGKLAFWQPVTYLFLHNPGGFLHILLNMLTLYMFGADLERDWGTRRFLKYYFVCGIGAALTVILVHLITQSPASWTIGASGAVYGVLLAYGVMYPDRELLFNFLFPIKAKYLVMIYGGIAFLSTFGATGDGISHVAHLGGMLVGFFYLRSPQSGNRRTSRGSFSTSIQNWITNYKRQRAKKKFEVYIRKQQDRNRYMQ
ncbi:MAG TPA: rhomboid family intramembrane serine protease [Bryobacteraceae bacterium]|nr:rhomboid family intramembrane serine protease [Bryobacteraceae bacterium]